MLVLVESDGLLKPLFPDITPRANNVANDFDEELGHLG
jgi:hypothetical protein